MKTIKYISAMVVIFSALVLPGCKKNFDNINNDPNSPKEVPNSYLLSGAEKGVIDHTCDYWWNGNVGAQLAQYWASNTYTDESRYFFRTNVTNDYWGYFYAGGINDATTTGVNVGGLEELQTIINNCKANPLKYAATGDPNNQIAIATALKVWLMQNITDTWGDVPYSKALLGAANTQPAFDKQSDIYPALIAELDTAYARINLSGAAVQGDLVYGGDITGWKKFMNSLKLRLALRMSDRNPALANQKMTEAINGGVITLASDAALFPYVSSTPNFNPYYYEYAQVGRRDFSSTKVMVDLLNGLNDPRVGQYYSSVGEGTYVGRPYGQSDANAVTMSPNSVSQPSPYVESATFPGIYMDLAQVDFMLAEAAARGVAVAGDPASNYKKAIQASFDFWSAGNATTYLAQSTVDYATLIGSGKTYKQVIGAQKWIALYMQGIQGWIEWRRLDFGILQLPVDGVEQGTGIPTRMLYPVNEQITNAKSYAGAVANMGPDLLSTKVWWDIY